MKKLVVYTITAIKALLAIIRFIPFGALTLYIVSDLCVFVFDKLFLTIGTIASYFKNQDEENEFAETEAYWKDNAIINDIKLNVSGKYVLNALLRKKDNPPHLAFGNRFHTVSDTMGRIKLTKFGRWWDQTFLNALEPSHTKKAVELNNKALLNRAKELGLTP